MKANDLDMAKILLVVLEIDMQKSNSENKIISNKIKELYSDYKNQNSDWEKIVQKYNEIISVEK